MILHDDEMTLGAIREVGRIRVAVIRLATDQVGLFSFFSGSGSAITREWDGDK